MREAYFFGRIFFNLDQDLSIPRTADESQQRPGTGVFAERIVGTETMLVVGVEVVI